MKRLLVVLIVFMCVSLALAQLSGRNRRVLGSGQGMQRANSVADTTHYFKTADTKKFKTADGKYFTLSTGTP